MSRRHQGKQKPTYKSLKAQGKVMSPDGDIIKVPKKHVGRGGGAQGVKGDMTVQHRWSGAGSEGRSGKIKPESSKIHNISSEKTAKRKGIKRKKPQPQKSEFLEEHYGKDWA